MLAYMIKLPSDKPIHYLGNIAKRLKDSFFQYYMNRTRPEGANAVSLKDEENL
jgi:hypothetical protein